MKELYQKLLDGEHLTDHELERLSNHMGAAAHILSQLGPVFTLTTQELFRRAEQCKGYLSEREKNKISMSRSN